MSTIDVFNTMVYARMMNKDTSTIHESQSLALGTPNPVATSQSVLPYYVDDTKKTKYLSFRATGFTSSEAVELADVTERTVKRWRAADAEFKRFDTTDVAELRQSHGAAYHSAEFQRNLRSFMELDRRVLSRALTVISDGGELGQMDPAEQGYLKTIRPLYSAGNLAAMIKAVNSGDEEVLSGFDFSDMVMKMNKIRIDVTKASVVMNGQTIHEESQVTGIGTPEYQEGPSTD